MKSLRVYEVINRVTGETVSFTYEYPQAQGPRYDANELLGISAYSWTVVAQSQFGYNDKYMSPADLAGSLRGLVETQHKGVYYSPDAAESCYRQTLDAAGDAAQFLARLSSLMSTWTWGEYAGPSGKALREAVGELLWD